MSMVMKSCFQHPFSKFLHYTTIPSIPRHNNSIQHLSIWEQRKYYHSVIIISIFVEACSYILYNNYYNNITNLYKVTFSVKATAITKDPI